MKKIMTLILFMVITASFAIAQTNTEGRNTEMEISEITKKVPENVMHKYEKSFVYTKNGIFEAARVDMLQPYLSNSEVLDLVKSNVPNGYESVVYEGYKPKGRGMKKNSKWISIIIDNKVIHE